MIRRLRSTAQGIFLKEYNVNISGKTNATHPAGASFISTVKKPMHERAHATGHNHAWILHQRFCVYVCPAEREIHRVACGDVAGMEILSAENSMWQISFETKAVEIGQKSLETSLGASALTRTSREKKNR